MQKPATFSATLAHWARGLKRDGITLWFVCRHPDTPLLVKAICWFVVAYALSPIDLIPDFIPVIGYLDDLILLPGLIWLAVRLTPPPVLAECRTRATEHLAQQGGKPRSLWGAILVCLVWLAIAWAVWQHLIAPWV